jgi:hypothetical protein
LDRGPRSAAGGARPFALSEPARGRNLLTTAGFTEPRIEGLNEPMYFGNDTDEAY